MPQTGAHEPPSFGTKRLRLPDELRGPLKAHLADLKEQYLKLDWAGSVGFGKRPALLVIDLALQWTKPDSLPFGSSMDAVVEATARLLEAARQRGVPVFFTTYDYDPAEPPSPYDKRLFRVFSGCPVDPCAIMQFLWDRYRPLRSSLAADRAPASHKSLITFMLA